MPYFNRTAFDIRSPGWLQKSARPPEEYKSWSQNLGLQGVLTIFYSYGEVATRRQGEIIRELAMPRRMAPARITEIVQRVVREVSNA
jgi:integrase/recombinase XerD